MRNLLIRRSNITANRLVDESSVKKEEVYEQNNGIGDKGISGIAGFLLCEKYHGHIS